MSSKFLWIEDNETIIQMQKGYLAQAYPDDEFVIVSSYVDATRALDEQGPFDACINDLFYSGINDQGQLNRKGSGGSDFLDYVRMQGIITPIVMWGTYPPNMIEEELGKRQLQSVPAIIFSKSNTHLVDVIACIKKTFCPSGETQHRLKAEAKIEYVPH